LRQRLPPALLFAQTLKMLLRLEGDDGCLRMTAIFNDRFTCFKNNEKL
jgi:hypothetical protein